MNQEEKVLYYFMENKMLLKEFCDNYVAIKKNEETLREEYNKIKLQNVQLQNEIEKYVQIIKDIGIKKEKEIDSSMFEYDAKIKKLEKEIEFLNDSLNTERSNYNDKVKEYTYLQGEYEKCKEYLKTEKNQNDIDTIHNNDRKNNNDNYINHNNINHNNINHNNINHNNINQNNIIVLNKIYNNIDEKVKDVVEQIKEIKTCRHYMEQNIKEYQSLLNDYLERITDLHLKYDECYKLYKQNQYKNLIYKCQKKLFLGEIELLKNNNEMLKNEIIFFKKNIKKVNEEKKEYYTLFKKSEDENHSCLNKLKKRKYKEMLQDLENTNTNADTNTDTNTNKNTNTNTNTNTTILCSSKLQLVQKTEENNFQNIIHNDLKYKEHIKYENQMIYDNHIINDNHIIHNNNIKNNKYIKLEQGESPLIKESPKDKTTSIINTPNINNISDNKQDLTNDEMININHVSSKMIFVSNKVHAQNESEISKGMFFFSDSDINKKKKKKLYMYFSI
ncbi:conserved Plasmodium protein, unknown function [Plasmodium gaboni]|uniref:Uncharacterized protein n=1 Tax=Plasmodium gaboni TaxID=647221 RepID=A0ABY1UT10_9APIC|nr:conserved Plasmodium protein, unknown function [Plasmodium gaboni]